MREEQERGKDAVPLVEEELAELKAQWECESEWGAGLNPLHDGPEPGLLGSLLVARRAPRLIDSPTGSP